MSQKITPRIALFRVYCYDVPKAIIKIGVKIKKRIAAEFEWGQFSMTKHNLHFKFSAIEEILIKPIRFNCSPFRGCLYEPG